MITYIHKQDGFVEVEQEFTSPFDTNVGYTVQDYEKGQWIKLNEDQLAFREENQNASMLEVFNMQLDKVDNLTEAKNTKLQELEQIVTDNSTFKLVTTDGVIDAWNWDLDKFIKLCDAAILTGQGKIQKDGFNYEPFSLKTALYQLLVNKNNIEDSVQQYKNKINNCTTIEEIKSIIFEFEITNSAVVELV